MPSVLIITNVSPGAIYTTLYDQSLSVTCGRSVVICGYSRILHQKNTDYQDITEILLKVTLQKKINNANNLKSRINCRFWMSMPSPRLLRDVHTMKHKSTWHPIFLEPLHFKCSVVLPNHIFIAFNYQIYKLLVLKFYLI